MKPIRIQKNYIQVPFVDEEGNVVLELKFELTDDSLSVLLNKQQEIKNMIVEQDDNEDTDFAKSQLAEAYNAILGEGTFDKVYEINPSVIVLTSYLIQITEGLLNEIMQKMKADAMNKYISGNRNETKITTVSRK